MRVEELIDAENGEWKVDLVRSMFEEQESKLILKLLLASPLARDTRYWWPTKDGVFSVRSCYRLGKLGHIRNWQSQHGMVDEDVWKIISNIEGPPKLSHFLWRVCTGSLAVMSRLNQRHIVSHSRCQVCGEEVESIAHTLFDCTYAMEIWRHSGLLNVFFDMPTTSMGERLRWVANKVDKMELRQFCALMWAAWSCRNMYIFEQTQPCATQVAVGYCRLVEDYKCYAEKVFWHGGQAGIGSTAGWVPPGQNKVKVNVDAHIREGRYVALGAVLWDHRGQVLATATRKMEIWWEPEWAEAAAAVFGLRMARTLGHSRVQLESDALTMVNKIKNDTHGLSPMFVFFEEISVLKVARRDINMGDTLVCTSDFPQSIISLAELDLMQ
ncbi:hypothetical protein RDABS01_011532 [Bienertia sinuspersici]